MRSRNIQAATAFIGIMAMALSGCGMSGGPQAADGQPLDSNTKVELTMSGWNLGTTPEFDTIVNSFHEAHPNITVNLKAYSAEDYDKQLTVDLSGGTGPDIVTMKTLGKYATYVGGDTLQDITDIANRMKGDQYDPSAYDLGGKTYSLPYRMDSYVMYYNKTMFNKAGVAEPLASWTWNDFMTTARELKAKLPATGYDANAVKPAYFHTSWQQIPQSIALVQTKGADLLSGNYDYMKPYYERMLTMQDEDLILNYGTVSSSRTQYQAQFSTEKAAMMPIGTWYIIDMITQKQKGDGANFEWGIAPLPQNPDEPLPSTPLTVASIAGLGISASATGDKLKAAREFVEWVCGEKGAKAIAALGLTPAFKNDAVEQVFFGQQGVPNDDLSRKAWAGQKPLIDSPASAGTDEVLTILKATHSAILTKSDSIDDAIASATSQIKNSGALDR